MIVDIRGEKFVIVEEKYFKQGDEVFKRYRIKSGDAWGEWINELTPLKDVPYVFLKDLPDTP